MRLISIGHEDARFEDVTLRFTDRAGNPTNSVIWLRNGGGKTSLLSLFFAGVRPHQRDFLGKRAESKVKSIDDYVGPRDHGVVACEWVLDAERGLFDDGGPRYITGVYYQRASSHEQNDQSGVERLFFASLVSPTATELTLEGLPLFAESPSGKARRSLTGFRRQWRQLNSEHPALEVFYSDKQNTFEEELTSRGIDPDVFFYQVQMNEREGGVLEKFSFSHDEDFIDFLLEVAYSPRRAREVREQLTVFRQELVERNERLKPELEYCRGLVVGLETLVGVARERATVFGSLSNCQGRLRDLKGWVVERLESLQQEQSTLETKVEEGQKVADELRDAAERSRRLAAVYRRHLAQRRFEAVDSEYAIAQQARVDAQRSKSIWNAARPLAREWEASRLAKQYRDLLAQKLQEHAPQLAELKAKGSQLADALEFEATSLRTAEAELRAEAELLAMKSASARDESAALGEKAATSESDVKRVAELMGRAEKELVHLKATGALLEEESSAERAAARLMDELQRLATERNDVQATIEEKHEAREKISAEIQIVEQSQRAREKELECLTSTWTAANKRRIELEVNAALLRLLQADKIDLQAAAARAVDTASAELRRVAESILRIRLEAAEELRALHWLEGDAELLPPSKDVESLLAWFKSRKVTCWSGWEYIAGNVPEQEKRAVVERVPYLAAGIVVADPHYELAIEVVGAENWGDEMRLAGPVAILPAAAISDRHDVTWAIVGPTSDGHFDKAAAALELNRIRAVEALRQTEIDSHESWRDELSALQHALRVFQADFPAGWFGKQRQAIDVCDTRLHEESENRAGLEKQLTSLDAELQQADRVLKSLTKQQNERERHQDRVETYLRQFGLQLSQWTQEVEAARRDARQLRAQQAKQKELAGQYWAEAKKKEGAASECGAKAARIEDEQSQIKFLDEDRRQAAAGAIDSLRSDYHLLLDDYQQKVNADALSQLAEVKDREANTAQREFFEVLGQYGDIVADDVKRELGNLEPGMSAERRFQQADKEATEVSQKVGTVASRRSPAQKELTEAKLECETLAEIGPLPEPVIHATEELNEAALQKCRAEADDHLQMAKEFHSEAVELADRLTRISHERDILSKDGRTLESLSSGNQDQFERLTDNLAASASDAAALRAPARVRDANDLAQQIAALEQQLQAARGQQQELDGRRDQVAQEIGDWSRQERFARFPDSVSHRFGTRRPVELESKAGFFVSQLDDTIFQIEQKLEEANKHHDRVVNIVLSAVDEGLNLLKQISSMSRLPESLPHAGKQFVVIETKAAESPAERRARVADLIEELLQTGDVGKDDVALIQKAVRRVAGRTKVRVLHPDLHHHARRVTISEMLKLSTGERLTAAILLYCALVRLRNAEQGRRGSSVLVLDNPFGAASRQSFVDLQREVAQSMNVQLIYATGIKDLSAIGALENIIRLRNSRADRRTGRRLVEVEDHGAETEQSGQIEAARVTFDSPASSLIRGNGEEMSTGHPRRNAIDDAVRD
jgi:chromosome segregation ATPase